MILRGRADQQHLGILFPDLSYLPRQPVALVGECLMALDLEPGSYHIELKYEPYGLRQGILLSATSVVIFGAVMLLRRRKENR